MGFALATLSPGNTIVAGPLARAAISPSSAAAVSKRMPIVSAARWPVPPV